MRASLKTTLALSLAALTMALAVCATPAAAGPIKKLYPPHFGHFHHGWGPGFGLGLGLIGAAVAADYAYDSCMSIARSTTAGHFVGRRRSTSATDL